MRRDDTGHADLAELPSGGESPSGLWGLSEELTCSRRAWPSSLGGALTPAIVLVGIGLPNGDGFEVAEQLAKRDDSPVVILVSSRGIAD